MILDSDVIIFLCNGLAQDKIPKNKPLFASVISKIEVLGYHRLTDFEKSKLSHFFDTITVLPLNAMIEKEAIRIRQTRNISLEDAIVAATAICHDDTLMTANGDAFDWISGLEIISPVS
ncbi:MAG: type II toxin-antitoxin system VapC family toxin [Leptospira sp.]|jgi:predicted nucleic acid-binding protein|nr:type II toxin-antitoxin system VapC family toxin [Leptospira sp.]